VSRIDLLLAAPVLLPLVTAALSLLVRRSLPAQRALGVLGGAGLLLAGVTLLIAVWQHGVLVTHFGGWRAPFGIVFACDLLGAAMTAITGLMGFVIAIYSLGSIDEARERAGYWPLLATLLMGVSGAFLTGDLFNLYVWFEVMLMASFALMALGAERGQLEGAVKYLVLSLLSSTIFLTAVGLIYGTTGTLNFAELSERAPHVLAPGMRTTLSMLLFAAFGLKAAVFPLFAWLPASYHTPPPAVSAVFAGLLTKVGVYALIRTFTLFFPFGAGSLTAHVLAWTAGLTMVVGVLGAAAQNDVRRVLSFHIVSQIGYMVLGLALATPLALAGAVFYLVHHIVTKTNLFLVAGVVRRLRGTEDLARLGGLYSSAPALSVLFLVPALSLAGIPPLSGFWAKLVVFQAGLEAEAYVLVAAAAVVSLLTIYSMTKIWSEAFWKDAPEEHPEREHGPASMVLPIALLAAVTVGMGLAAGPVFDLAERAAEQLIDPRAYVDAVLGGGR
jgi:multicomponent Na+:H+ antiporter subunit D